MATRREELGLLVQSLRQDSGLTQDDVATKCSTNRSVIAHLEQGLRIPKEDLLESICKVLRVPPRYWEEFTRRDSLLRLEFEELLSELVGTPVSLDYHSEQTRDSAERQVASLFAGAGSATPLQVVDAFNSVITYYGPYSVTRAFFDTYLGKPAFVSTKKFEAAIEKFHIDAIRLYSSLSIAFRAMSEAPDLSSLLAPLQARPTSRFEERSEWAISDPIPSERLPDLGYIAAAQVKKQQAERAALKEFLLALAAQIRAQGASAALAAINEKTRRRMDSLLRQFDSRLEHTLLSPLFRPDPDVIEAEAQRLAPPSDEALHRMAESQAKGLRNLAQYLTADHMDAYIATSMREDTDFESVNAFVASLFAHDDVRPFKLRYFNPTQSWIEDRIAKGLVEAVMLRRCSIAVYMAQKSDTFGKDSEASVALGQGKPVIVYVPKLVVADGRLDSERLFSKERAELIQLVARLDSVPEADIDGSIDQQDLVGKVLASELGKTSDEALIATVRQHHADFDLRGEAIRIIDHDKREAYRRWLQDAVAMTASAIPIGIREELVGILVASAVNFEKRAKLFREMHPLALQVILSSGVLNGILVVRSVDQCAHVLSALLRNSLDLVYKKDEANYRIVEKTTGSTIRVVSRNRLLRNAFTRLYVQALSQDG